MPKALPMDRSLDSIGSCSLDVDADSSDISDTSGSLNFPTPLSVKDITREFTANIKERCTLRSPQQPQPQPQRTLTTNSYVNLDQRTGGVRMVLSPPDLVDDSQQPHNNSSGSGGSSGGNGSLVLVDAGEKKPSYLNLACCVNGYSNLTTYDSKIRQDINKSREVSPIRPSTSSLQYCKRNNSLAAPVLHTMPLTQQPVKVNQKANKYTMIINETNNNNNNTSKNGHLENGDGHGYCNGGSAANKSLSLGAATTTTGSFIQQRVERLYGPGALAQGFYSPKKHSSSPVGRQQQLQQQQQQQQLQQSQQESPQITELSRKFKQLSPSKDYGEFRRKLQTNCTQAATARSQSEQPAATHNGDVDLPVFRHLSHEFRAQLPTVSPKRNVQRISPAPELVVPPPPSSNGLQLAADVVDHEPIRTEEEYLGTTKISAPAELAAVKAVPEAKETAAVKDGNYFLKILKDEQVRLLALAAVAEKYIDALTNNPDITEDTFGLLRAASGKARLLATQKMKQFEGLCHNNLNRSPEDAFPTTLDDLQGFWDMVYLQVTHVDTIFEDIEQLKRSDWQRAIDPKSELAPIKTTTKPTAKTGNQKAKTTGGGASNAVAAMKREAQRKQLLEMKRQRREALAAAAKNQTACDDIVSDTVNIAVKNSS
ncbi:vlc, isoform D [Drosophila virilis]|uniref:Vlc, isoform D n=1 Tax=Drosophila virilis TaxID=7244 RepID=A0A0Q9VXZ0_DROVI|nr:vlc, isoform D [Drosophila virilis]